VSASQALSSETSVDRLHARVVEVLSAMTGATGVHLLLWSEDRHHWLLPAPDAADKAYLGTYRAREVFLGCAAGFSLPWERPIAFDQLLPGAGGRFGHVSGTE
jgi:hypothetical protein